MSEHTGSQSSSHGGDRGRRRSRRRGGGGREGRETRPRSREKDKDNSASGPSGSGTIKAPIILAKPHTEKNRDSSTSGSGSSDSKPIVLIKPREDTSSASSSQSTGIATSGTAAAQVAPSDGFHGDQSGRGQPTQQPTYQIQRNVSSVAAFNESSQTRLAPPPEMTQPVKLVDDSLNWCDSGIDMLLDQTDFLVVGVVGMEGVGKSTILSLLAGNHPEQSNRSFVFKPQSEETLETAGHQTVGVDLFVTPERIILIDTQPILSASVLDQLIHHDRKLPPEVGLAENWAEVLSLQLTAFLMTVCHVVVVVQDWFTDLNLYRFLQTAEMLKPPTPAPSHDTPSSSGSLDEQGDYFPAVVFVQNRATREDFQPSRVQAMKTTVDRLLQHASMRYKNAVSMSVNGLMPARQKSPSGDVSLFLFPDFPHKPAKQNGKVNGMTSVLSLVPDYQGHPSPQALTDSFRNQIFSVPRTPLTHHSLTEKNWFHYAARTWEGVRKSNLMAEYSRLLT
ncbi:nonsense-mediated mRNA decay factor SMG9-like [Branchiostoma lanceolatum]|uniref:nonsense-mediated mRNA decay factor SMG9-like n=1 Tax=Branchiostoma lanceolatum TaxID=7740 RepID=UPI0034536593